MRYWATVVPIDERYILLLFRSLQDASCLALGFTHTNGSRIGARLSALFKTNGLAEHEVLDYSDSD
jgi:hypothetical protein